MANGRASLAAVGEKAKALGAFYTDRKVADFLVWWAVRSADDTVMDPSFGGGVFLRSVCSRLEELGGQVKDRLFGVELDAETHSRAVRALSEMHGLDGQHLLNGDFFRVHHEYLEEMDAVVGNPPFIRYQRFSGEKRKNALRRAAAHGVALSELTSSWAPFLVCSIAALKTDGRLAMVVPMEIAHAGYARPVFGHLAKVFARVTFLSFRRKLFPELSEDVLLLLAEGKACGNGVVLWRDLENAAQLEEVMRQGSRAVRGTRRVDAEALSDGRTRFLEYLIPDAARDLYRSLKESAETKRLGQIADVGIGYVTGANRYFHLHSEDLQRWSIPREYLRPAVLRSGGLSGLSLTLQDWCEASERGDAGYLLLVRSDKRLPATVRRYLEHGQAQGVPKGYKCRSRRYWFAVPHVFEPDAFLTYMNGRSPRLVANHAGAVAPNTLHVLRLRPEEGFSGFALAALWQTSLTRVSAEIEGHALGGGMLKLEPSEAESVIVAAPARSNGQIEEVAGEIDRLLRKGAHRNALSLADEVLLQKGVGLSAKDCSLLRKASAKLRGRRHLRSKRR